VAATPDRRDALVQRLFEATLGTWDLLAVYLGSRLGLYRALPVGLVGEGAAGTGTVMRADTVKRYADEAGFGAFEVLPIENDFYRFYRLVP
jgi:hypothetical protein